MKKVPAPSPTTERVYATVCEAMTALGAEAGTMFGMPTLKRGGKAFAGQFGDAMVFKLAGASHATALALKGAELFDPSGMGRPMKAWVVLPAAQHKAWTKMAATALEALDAAPTKPAAKKTATKNSKAASKAPRAK